ncbi:MAG: hypothetical protein QM747_12080 [Nocardioides sp.]
MRSTKKAAADETTAWVPDDLPVPVSRVATWSYVVVEEIVEGLVTLRRWPWPTVDQLGRLRWLDGTDVSTDAVIEHGLLRAQVYTPNGIRREPRCGDTFAASAAPRPRRRALTRVTDLREVLGSGAVYDLSASARQAAKVAFQGSQTAVRRPTRAELGTGSRSIAASRAPRLSRLRVVPPPSRGGRTAR